MLIPTDNFVSTAKHFTGLVFSFCALFLTCNLSHGKEMTPLTPEAADAIIAAREQARLDAERAKLEYLRSFVPKFQLQKTLDDGTRLTFNRIDAPNFPPKNTPVVQESNPNILDEIQEMSEKTAISLGISATVYDEEMTEVRFTENGKRFHAFVNINFFLFRGVGDLETTDAIYFINFGFGEGDREQEQQRIPEMTDFSSDEIEFLFADDCAPEFKNKLPEGIVALCQHYYQNKPALEIAHHNSKELQAAHDRYQKAHPKKPAEIIINAWK